MELVCGTVVTPDGARLERVTVSLVKRPRGAIAVSGWGGVFKCPYNAQLDLFREHKLNLDDGRSGVITIVHVSRIGDGLLALFRGVGPMVEPPLGRSEEKSDRDTSDNSRGERYKTNAPHKTDVDDDAYDVEGLALVEIG